MTKDILINKLSDTQHLNKSNVLQWVKSLPNYGFKVKPNVVKVGDVFMHRVFGHPYVILQKCGEFYMCVLLTTEETCKEILEPCSSRFFHDSFFTQNLLMVSAETTEGNEFYGVFDNTRQVKSVLNKLKTIMNQ